MIIFVIHKSAFLPSPPKRSDCVGEGSGVRGWELFLLSRQ